MTDFVDMFDCSDIVDSNPSHQPLVQLRVAPPDFVD
jgi:hypothetical protein